jgi:glc operon protein GlcG
MKTFGARLFAFALCLGLAAMVPSIMEAQALTYDQIKKAMDGAEAEASKNGWRLTIVIADSAGVPLYLRRMPGATPRSYEIAMAKVRTALTSRMHTVDYARALAAGQVDTVRGGVTFEGGLLIRVNGAIVGAMTASGARGSEDAQAVKAGLAAINIQP